MNEYVTAAYGVVLFGLLVYVVVVGMRAGRMAREAELLARLVERHAPHDPDADVEGEPEPVDVSPPAARS